MKSKTSLPLLELAIMLLVFSLAAALCLRGFFWADQKSEELALRDDALLLAQNGAEVLKHTQGDLQEAAILLHGRLEAGSLTVQQESLILTAAEADTGEALLGCIRITVRCGEELLCALDVFYQEAAYET